MSSNRGEPLVFKSPHRAKFHEIDPFGHVNTMHYVAYYNENRWIGIRAHLNLGFRDLGKLDFAFHARRMELNFMRPIVGDEEFSISSWVAETSESECIVKAEMRKGESLVSECLWQMVCVDTRTGKRKNWDTSFMDKFYQMKDAN